MKNPSIPSIPTTNNNDNDAELIVTIPRPVAPNLISQPLRHQHHLLPDDVLGNVFQYLGPGNFFYINSTSNQFARVYRKTFFHTTHNSVLLDDGGRRDNNIENNDSVSKIPKKRFCLLEDQNNYHHSQFIQKKKIANSSISTIIESVSQCKLFLREEGITRSNLVKIGRSMAKSGNLKVLKYVIEEQPLGIVCLKQDYGICHNSAMSGHLHILKYARSVVGCPWDYRSSYHAYHNGHFNILIWANDNGCRVINFNNIGIPMQIENDDHDDHE